MGNEAFGKVRNPIALQTPKSTQNPTSTPNNFINLAIAAEAVKLIFRTSEGRSPKPRAPWRGLSISKNKFYRFGGGSTIRFEIERKKLRASKNLSGSQKQKKETP